RPHKQQVPRPTSRQATSLRSAWIVPDFASHSSAPPSCSPWRRPLPPLLKPAGRKGLLPKNSHRFLPALSVGFSTYLMRIQAARPPCNTPAIVVLLATFRPTECLDGVRGISFACGLPHTNLARGPPPAGSSRR